MVTLIERGIKTMNEIQIVKQIMRSRKISAKVLAENLGYNTPSAVSNRLQSKTMTVEILLNMLAEMDCELVIRERTGDKNTFVVTNDERNEVKSYNTSKKKGGEE
jgi:transcriptional regulator with XRE-family HTH domain